MERAKFINPARITWCCEQNRIAVHDLVKQLRIPINSLEKTMRGEEGITVNQLKKIAEIFNRGMLFFLEPGPVDEAMANTPQFRTITNQKPTLPINLKSLIRRVEKQRKIYISLIEDLGQEKINPWDGLDIGDFLEFNVKQSAGLVRTWLGLGDQGSFDAHREAVERRGVFVFVSNGYKGQWKIAKENPIRGFSLYFDSYPIVAIKKQASVGPQAFTLMHELAHLILHRGSFIDDEDDFYSYQGKEKVANEFAGNVLVPDEFLETISLHDFPYNEVRSYDGYLRSYANSWGVSVEVVLRRLLNEGFLFKEQYQQYRDWKKNVPPKKQEGGMRYRHREPAKIFGASFVDTVLDALHARHITLARASRYLDNLKIADIHKLEGRDAYT